MIPKFPDFKKLELADKFDIETFTQKYLPYSDFNFTSMWSWDIKKNMIWSVLNGNLVVRFNDYITGESFFSYLGTHKVNDTIIKLIEYAKNDCKSSILKLVPELCIEGIDTSLYIVKEDINNFDYLYDISSLSAYRGNKFLTQRNMVNRLLKHHPEIQSKLINIHQTSIQKEVLQLVDVWEKNKIDSHKSIEKENELLALRKLFGSINEINLVCVGVYSHNELIAFSLNELLPSDYAIAHFAKSNVLFPGIYAYLMRETNRVLSQHERKVLNFEQDLGLNNLRYSKRSFRPISFLKKYTISIV